MIAELHRRLKGRTHSEQVVLLSSVDLADVDREAMDDLASDVRVGSAHEENPVGSSAYCPTCRLVDFGTDCDLSYHPWAAP